MNLATASASTLEFKRLIKAPVARVFAAWITPEEIGRWLGGETWKVAWARIDLRVGGEYRIHLINADREIEMCGVYREVVPPTRLVFTWRHEGDPEMAAFPETLVTVELADVDGATELRLTHAGFTDEGYREDHAEGWTSCLDGIERLVAAVPVRLTPAG